jgi:hypothetical protein
VPYDLETVRANLRAREEAAAAARAANPPRQKRRNGPRPPIVKDRIRQTQRQRAAVAALARPDCPTLTKLRINAGLTQKELAEAAGFESANNVIRAETDPDRVSDSAWRRIAVALGVGVEQIRWSRDVRY